jgi:DNA-directed RNA polymerase II subunit RPB2
MEKLQDELLQSHDRVRNYATDAIANFDEFMFHMMPYIVCEFSKIEVVEGTTRHLVRFGNVTVHKPLVLDAASVQKTMKVMTNDPLYPREARARGLTYSCHVQVDVEYIIFENDVQVQRTVYKEVPLFFMPVMLRSKYCHLSNLRNFEAMRECEYDSGGYFIIRGNAKVIQPQKVQRINVHIVRTAQGELPIDAEIRSLRADEKFRSTSTLYIHYAGSPATFKLDIPFLAPGISLVAVLRALGFNTKDEMEEFLWDDHADPRRRLVAAMYEDPVLHMSIDQVFEHMGRGMYNENDLTPEKRRNQVLQQIKGELLPHVGFDDEPHTKFKKAAYLRIIVLHMLDVHLGNAEPDDRDFEGYKTVHMSAVILSTMFRQLFSAFVKTIRNKMYDRFKKSKHIDIGMLIAHSEALTRDLLKAFSEGEVTVKQASNSGSGVIQLVHQVNPLGLTTHVQRVSTALPRDGKYTLMRGIDTTQLFSYCPAETPEGECAGLLQNLTLFAKVRIGTPGPMIESTLLRTIPSFAEEHGIVECVIGRLDSREHLKETIVFVNSDPVAYTTSPETLIQLLRMARRAHVLPIDTSIIRARHGILVFSDMGTVTFPLIHLESFKSRYEDGPGELWPRLLANGIIEYVDAWELLEYRVAFSPKEELEDFTHMAVHPCALLGMSACTVPWSDHDQAPRVSYQAGMVKQAISTPATNLAERLDFNYAHELWYPQMPMADTIVSRSRGLQDWPMGENKLIAIASYTGLSQEDSIIVNRSSIDRGSGRVSLFRIFKAIVRKIGSDYEAFESALDDSKGACLGLRGESDYSKLDHHGLPTLGTYIQNGDAIIGRVLYTTDEKGNAIRRDRSIIMTCEDSEAYIVDTVAITNNRDGHLQVRVRLRTTRVPQFGDKLSDRHGQKGVIGGILDEVDMPFVMSGPNEGMRPDLIVNLHSINGRMTIGKLLEMLYSSLGLAAGELVDATPFKEISAKDAMEELLRRGYGTETTMINGMTGEVMDQPWFLGSCFYQTLKHMVLDKVHARARGPKAQLTRQPLDGRANQGGQRFGEMEKDALLASGASFALDDRSRVASDGHTTWACKTCGQVGESWTKFTLANLEAGKQRVCKICGGELTSLDSLYCWSGLFVKEMATLGVKVAHEFSEVK